MATKRKNTESDYGPTAREKKKLKLADARAISVQITPPSSSGAGPSNPRRSGAVTFDSVSPSSSCLAFSNLPIAGMAGLPGALDVEKFAEVNTNLFTRTSPLSFPPGSIL
jgi:hypothetical protein